MVNAEVIQIPMLRARGRRRDASVIYWNLLKLIQSTEIALHSKTTGSPTIDLVPP